MQIFVNARKLHCWTFRSPPHTKPKTDSKSQMRALALCAASDHMDEMFIVRTIIYTVDLITRHLPQPHTQMYLKIHSATEISWPRPRKKYLFCCGHVQIKTVHSAHGEASVATAAGRQTRAWRTNSRALPNSNIMYTNICL